MSIRKEVEKLAAFGKMPCSEDGLEKIKSFEEKLHNIKTPISSEEALALKDLFNDNEDDCFGLAWTLLHIVETTPTECLQDLSKERGVWFSIIRQRLTNKTQ